MISFAIRLLFGIVVIYSSELIARFAIEKFEADIFSTAFVAGIMCAALLPKLWRHRS